MIVGRLQNIDFLSWQFYPILLLAVVIFWFVAGKYRKFILIAVSIAFYLSNGLNSVIMILYLITASWIMSFLQTKMNKSKFFLGFGITLVMVPFILNRVLLMIRNREWLTVNVNIVNFLSCIGLAYTTLMAVSYMIDIYLERYSMVRFIDYTAIIAFFPYAVSGPIERIDHMDVQMRKIESKGFSWKELQSGTILIIYGLFEKLVVADRLGILVNEVFDNYHFYLGMELLFSLVLYGIEIYCDFSACSNIARGVARCFGINIINNFTEPYFSKSIGEFWRKWHRSLSLWLRDYVYIPLGGNRKGKGRQYINICITFVISGAWHGFSPHFILWGIIHAAYQVIGKAADGIRKRMCRLWNINPETLGHKFVQMLITFGLVDIAWLFFRMEHISDAVNIIHRIVYGMDLSFINRGYLTLGLGQLDWNVLILCGGIILFVDLMHYIYKEQFMSKFLNENLYVKYGVYLLLFVLTVIFGVYGAGFNSASFIYRGF